MIASIHACDLPEDIRRFIPSVVMMPFAGSEEKMLQRLFTDIHRCEDQVYSLRERRYSFYTCISTKATDEYLKG